MNQDQLPTSPWPVFLLLTLGVAVVVIIALLLAQIDTFQRRSAVPANGPPIVDLEGTIAAGELDTIYLPSDVTPTATVLATPTVTATETAVSEGTPEPTGAEAYPTCASATANGSAYVVQPGETIAAIAANFGLSEELILEANCLASDQVIAGQQIFIPQASSFNQVPKSCEQPLHWKPHRVKPGDTLPKLARTYGTTPYYIMKANCLEEVQLQTDSEIYLPEQPLDHTDSD